MGPLSINWSRWGATKYISGGLGNPYIMDCNGHHVIPYFRFGGTAGEMNMLPGSPILILLTHYVSTSTVSEPLCRLRRDVDNECVDSRNPEHVGTSIMS